MASVPQKSFAGGYLGPALQGRTDQQKYAVGLKRVENCTIQRFGGVQNRAGTNFITQTKSDGYVSLKKFVFNTDQSFVLECGALYIRFYQLEQQVTLASTPAAYNGATAYIVGDLVNYGGFNYYAIAASTGAQPDISPLSWYPLTGTIYEIPTPYTADEVDDVQISQSADVVNFTHPNHPPYELKRFGTTLWTFTVKAFGPVILAPTGLTSSSPGAGFSYVVTTVALNTLEESLPSAAVVATTQTSTLTWVAAASALEYNIYKSLNGVYGFIGTAAGLTFTDATITPDTTDSPPSNNTPFAAPGDYPATSNYFQQRLFFARTDNDPEKVWASRAGQFNNYTTRSPLQDDDAISFTVVGRQVNEIRSLLDLGRLFIMSAGTEYQAEGDGSGTITPTTINLRQQGTRGTSKLPPVTIENSAIFVQARGSLVRDLRFNFDTDGYTGRDLTVFAPDLFTGYTITSFDYQENPDSILWFARDDGKMLGLTYMREQEVWAWHVHETDGIIESVCVIPEDGTDYLYLSAARTVNGTTKRCIERMVSRNFTSIITDAIFMDSTQTYNGTNTGSTSLTLTGGVTWTYTEALTLTASVAQFTAGDVGNAYVLRLGTDSVRVIITAYTDTQNVSVVPDETVAEALRSVATTDWTAQVDTLSGLDHLNGKTVAILGDGGVVAPVVVVAGSITLARPYGVIHVGLPYTSTIECLDLETIQGPTFSNRKIDVKQITLQVLDTLGLKFGPDEDHLVEWKGLINPIPNTAPAPYSGRVEQNIKGRWTEGGSVVIQQTDPLPMNILTIIRTGEIGN